MDDRLKKPNLDEEEVYLLDYLNVVAKHSRMIIYSSLTVTVLIYLILFIYPNWYTATARLLRPQQNATLSGQLLENLGGGVTPGTGGANLGGMGLYLGLMSPTDLYVGMLEGDKIIDRIIARFNLRGLYGKKYIEDVRRKLKSRVDITGGKNGIISIEVTDKNPDVAAKMANAFIEELDKSLQEIALNEAKSRLAFMEKERDLANHNLNKAEEALRAFSEQNSLVQIDTQAKAVLEYIATLRGTIDSKEVKLQVLRQQATPFNYDVKQLETEIRGLKEKLQAAETQSDQKCFSDICIKTSKAPGLGIEYMRLFREVKFQEGLYQLYCKLVEIARLDQVRDFSVIQITDPASPPERRSNKRLIPAMLVGILTFIIMIFVAFGREYIHNIKTSPGQAQRLDVLATNLQPWTNKLIRIRNILKLREKSINKK